MGEEQEDKWGGHEYQRVHSLSGPPSRAIISRGNAISSLNHPQAYVLELGAGMGVMTQMLADKYRKTRVLATDLSEGMIAKINALELPGIKTEKLDAMNLKPVESEDITHIFTSATIQFCEDPKQPVREAYRVLKQSKERRLTKDKSAPDGVLAVGTWCKLGIEELFRAVYHELGIPEKIVTPFDPKKWPQDEEGVRREFEKAGFKNVQTTQEWMCDGRDIDAMLEHVLVWKNPGAIAMRQPALDQFGLDRCMEVTRKLLEQGARGEGRYGKRAEDLGVGQVIGFGTV